jgi:hypothetical protein
MHSKFMHQSASGVGSSDHQDDAEQVQDEEHSGQVCRSELGFLTPQEPWNHEDSQKKDR